ncbi:hypothetical protein B0H11DRAFT_1946378 [Mycena galericulata]|nr:hypothetical protein B0H11DRAFT_1946378 [Mycena galericulata]
MHLMLALYHKEAGRFVPSQTYFDFMTAGKNLFFCVAKTQLDDPDGKFWIIQPGSDPVEKSFGQVRTITGTDSNTDMYQLGSRLTAAVECDNILAEHPEWASDPRRLKLPVWHEVAGDVSAKFDHISPRIWVGDVHVKNVSNRTTWMGGKRIAEDDLRAAFLEPPFESMQRTGGFSIFCPFGQNKVVLITPPHPGERDEDPDESDIGRVSDFTSETAPSTNSAVDPDAPFLPDLDDMAQEAVSSLDSTTKLHDAYLAIPGSSKQQHKATILRIFSSRFSISESRDRLKRVRGFSRHNDVSSNSSNSDDPIPGEPVVVVQDPAAILVRSNGFTWLAVVSISGITCGTKHVDTLPKRLLGEPNVRARVQIMELVPAKNPPRVGSDEGDWEWSGKFVATAGTSKICEVDGSALQLLDPAVLPGSYSSKDPMLTYHFKSVELVAIAAAMEMRTRSTKKLPEVAFASTFPYRTSSGFACFVCNKDGSSLLQEEGLCTLCPKATLSVRSAYKLVEHMAIHILFDRNPPIDRKLNPCGFCLGTQCSIVLVKNKGGDGATRIDMTKSRCPNLANLGLKTAEKSSDRSPCTQRPFMCPVSPCPDTVWKYNLESHLSTVHPTANLSRFKSHYELAEGEEVALRTISTTKKRSSKKKKINFRISEEHSTEAALGEFSRLPGNSDDEVEADISGSSRSSSPDIDDSPTELRPLSPLNDDELPEPSALLVPSTPPTHLIAPTVTDEPPPMVVDQFEAAADPIPHASDHAPLTTEQDSNTSSGRPKPRRIPKRSANSTESAADDPDPPVTSTDAQQSGQSGSKTRSGRVTKKTKKLIILSDDEDEESRACTSPNCTVLDESPMIACSGPACTFLAHLCCVGIKANDPPTLWFCDDDCRGCPIWYGMSHVCVWDVHGVSHHYIWDIPPAEGGPEKFAWDVPYAVGCPIPVTSRLPSQGSQNGFLGRFGPVPYMVAYIAASTDTIWALRLLPFFSGAYSLPGADVANDRLIQVIDICSTTVFA